MAFLIYRRQQRENGWVLEQTGATFSLAGYNLIYKAWCARGKPMNSGWHVEAEELIRLHTEGKEGYDSLRFIIDFDPNARRRIGLVELLDAYCFTWESDAGGDAGWTPMMLRVQDVFYQKYERDITAEKAEWIRVLPEPGELRESVEFVYLNGTGKGWNWGRGTIAAVFIHGAAREYFRRHF